MTKQVKSKKRVADHGEVFTAAREVNAMLDMVKQETERIDSKFLEPACGNGNFLAEILCRKMNAVKKKYGQSICEYAQNAVVVLTSIYGIDLLEDNAKECRERLFKIWDKEYTAFCENAADDEYRKMAEYILEKNILCGDTLTLLRDDGTPMIFSEWAYVAGKITENTRYISDIKFDVIVGNPPYHLSDGGNGASAKPMYHLFVEQAKKLNPRFLTMIIPARWYAGGKGLDRFRNSMLNDRQITQLHDFVDASDCFTGVEIKGGVCYFLWENGKKGNCEVFTHKGDEIVSVMSRPLSEPGNNTFIRYNEAIQILRKVRSKGEATFDTVVSARKPFGFASNFRDYVKQQDSSHTIRIYAQKDRGFVAKEQIQKNVEWIDKWKVYIPEAIGAGKMKSDVVKPIVGKPGTVCSETYVLVGPLDSEKTAVNIESYVKTRFFHFMLGLKKITQHTTSKTYAFVPVQDFSKSWTDRELFEKYELSDEEIAFIEASVWPGRNTESVIE